MALVFIDDLTEGMVLAEDLLTPAGRFVLAAGAKIKADQLGLLKSWGIIEAEITESSLGKRYARQQELDAEFSDQADFLLKQRFVHNALDSEPVATLYRHAAHRCAQRLQQGWTPVLFSSTPDASVENQSSASMNMTQLLKGDVDIVSLPMVYSHIVELINQPNTSAHQLGRVISKDASLTVRLLRLVNSPFYGFSGKIDSVSRAVSLLGFNELTTLALGITVVQKFQAIPSEQLDMESFWCHSIRCGLFARTIADYIGEKNSERYFTGGLLHDIGRLVMLDRAPAQYRDAMSCARCKKLPMYRAELNSLKTDHSIIGKMLADKWRLSPSLARMIGNHHSPRMAHYPIEACIIHVADIFAHVCSDEILLVNEIPELQLPAWEKIGLSTDYIATAIKQVDIDFKEIVNVFLVNSKNLKV